MTVGDSGREGVKVFILSSARAHAEALALVGYHLRQALVVLAGLARIPLVEVTLETLPPHRGVRVG